MLTLYGKSAECFWPDFFFYVVLLRLFTGKLCKIFILNGELSFSLSLNSFLALVRS